MSESWEKVSSSEVRVGDWVRHPSGQEFEVARVDSPFLGYDAMICLIEDTPARWHAYPVQADGEIEVRRAQ